MNHDSKDNINETDPEEAIWKHHAKLGGPEQANKAVRKHRAKIMAIFIAFAIAALTVAEGRRRCQTPSFDSKDRKRGIEKGDKYNYREEKVSDTSI